MKNLTYKTFVDFVNKEFERLEIKNITAYKCERTYYRTQDYEGGACYLRVFFRNKENPKIEGHFMCFYPLKYYNKMIKEGYELYLNFSYRSTRTLFTELVIDLRKIK